MFAWAPGVRLDVDVVGAREQRQRAVAGEVLGDVHVLAAAVVALAGQALGVLVRQPRALRLEHRRVDVVLARDQLDLVAPGDDAPPPSPPTARGPGPRSTPRRRPARSPDGWRSPARRWRRTRADLLARRTRARVARGRSVGTRGAPRRGPRGSSYLPTSGTFDGREPFADLRRHTIRGATTMPRRYRRWDRGPARARRASDARRS